MSRLKSYCQRPLEEFSDLAGFPSCDQDAAELNQKAVNVDPFPSIPPGLLNSADLSDYVRQTGMIFPFSVDNLKTATYEAHIGKHLVYWDQKGNQIDQELENGEEFFLACLSAWHPHPPHLGWASSG